MRTVLTERNVVQYIQHKDTIKEFDQKADQQALTEILFALDKTQLRSVIHARNAYEAWTILKETHEHSSKSNCIFLKNQFYGLQMTDKVTNK